MHPEMPELRGAGRFDVILGLRWCILQKRGKFDAATKTYKRT
jgi:hypothetical protein